MAKKEAAQEPADAEVKPAGKQIDHYYCYRCVVGCQSFSRGDFWQKDAAPMRLRHAPALDLGGTRSSRPLSMKNGSGCSTLTIKAAPAATQVSVALMETQPWMRSRCICRCIGATV
jgi:hypothetical protein